MKITQHNDTVRKTYQRSEEKKNSMIGAFNNNVILFCNNEDMSALS